MESTKGKTINYLISLITDQKLFRVLFHLFFLSNYLIILYCYNWITIDQIHFKLKLNLFCTFKEIIILSLSKHKIQKKVD